MSDNILDSRVREKILSVTIARGWLPGTRVTFTDAWTSVEDGLMCDVILVLKDKPHLTFTRLAANLIYKTKISLGHALTGTTLHIPHVDGRILDVPINEIVQ